MPELKYMNIKEFVDEGYLQEANRQFFHPLGLALEIKTGNDGAEPWYLSGVWDNRDDPEGVMFCQHIIDEDKRRNVEELRKSKIEARSKRNRIGDDGIQKY